MDKRLIISASRRMDLPAFQLPAFLRWCRRGWIPVPNPIGGQISRVDLRSEALLGVVFWTRRPGALLQALPELDALFGRRRILVQVSLLGYPRELEVNAPPMQETRDDLLRLADELGPEAVRWRFDPLLLSRLTPVEFLLNRFAELAKELRGHQHYVYLSWLDRYRKIEARLPRDGEGNSLVFTPAHEMRAALAAELVQIALENELQPLACCEEELLQTPGIRRAACIDATFFEEANTLLPGAIASAPTRPGCGCARARDIGIYNQCAHGCVYCYASKAGITTVCRDPWAHYAIP